MKLLNPKPCVLLASMTAFLNPTIASRSMNKHERQIATIVQQAIDNPDMSPYHKTYFQAVLKRMWYCKINRKNRDGRRHCKPEGWTVSKLNLIVADALVNPTGKMEHIGDGAGDRDLGLSCSGADCSVPISLSGIWNYGCWCNFGTNLMNGQGSPQNVHDQICQNMQLCLRCARNDGGTNSDDECDPRTQEFTAGFAFGDASLVAECETHNNGDVCAINTCVCQMNLISDLVELIWDNTTYDPSQKQTTEGGEFDYEANCVPNNPSKGSGPSTECCGSYPNRFTYKANGNNQCCETHGVIYSSFTEQCCASGIESISDPCDP